MATKPRAPRRAVDRGVADVLTDAKRSHRHYAEIAAINAAIGDAPTWLSNWRDPSKYLDPSKEKSPERWAWEFLRRNPAYQEAFTKVAAAPCGLDMFKVPPIDSWAQTEPPALPGETLQQWKNRVRTGHWTTWLELAQDTFGLRTIRDPKLSDPPMFTRLGCTLVQHVAAEPNRPHEVFFKFDLRAPLTWQIEHVSQIFKEMARFGEKNGDFQTVNPRERTTDFRRYLRALDGQTYGVKQQKIADVLFPEIRHPLPRLKKVESLLKRARFYRDTGYRYLVELPPLSAHHKTRGLSRIRNAK